MNWLTELLADFCRWRAKRALRAAADELDRVTKWTQRERKIINGETNGTTKEG